MLINTVKGSQTSYKKTQDLPATAGEIFFREVFFFCNQLKKIVLGTFFRKNSGLRPEFWSGGSLEGRGGGVNFFPGGGPISRRGGGGAPPPAPPPLGHL